MLVSFGALALLAAFMLGEWAADRRWMAKGAMQNGRMLCQRRFFWVAAEDDPVACDYLLQLLEDERDAREELASVKRMQEGGAQ